jgi:chromosome partitioning protein
MTKIIGIVQVKGGVGRSTIATNLSAVLQKKAQTYLIDCDMPQGTSESWYAIRSEETRLKDPVRRLTLLTANSHQALVNHLKAIEKEDAYVVIDAPPRIAEVTRLIVMVSDLLLIPLAASEAEIWATTDLLDMIEEAQKEKPDIDARIIWNRFRSYTRSAQELGKSVKKELGIKEMRTKLGMRVAYVDALARGLSAGEWPGAKAARDEVIGLGMEVIRILK